MAVEMDKTLTRRVARLEGVVPAVFENHEEAEAAINELRSLGYGDDDLGVMIPDPEHYHLLDNSTMEFIKGLRTGGIVGLPLGAAAGISVAALLVPGLGIIGVGGALLWGGLGGAIWGAYLGANIGMAAEIRHIDEIERRFEIPLEPHQMLVVVIANRDARNVCEIMERHGAHCFWEHQ
jgi:hypothetical protein